MNLGPGPYLPVGTQLGRAVTDWGMLCVRAPLRCGVEKKPGLASVPGKSLVLSCADGECTDTLCIPKKIGLSSLLL